MKNTTLKLILIFDRQGDFVAVDIGADGVTRVRRARILDRVEQEIRDTLPWQKKRVNDFIIKNSYHMFEQEAERV